MGCIVCGPRPGGGGLDYVKATARVYMALTSGNRPGPIPGGMVFIIDDATHHHMAPMSVARDHTRGGREHARGRRVGGGRRVNMLGGRVGGGGWRLD